jgi:hypothetical protein
MTSFYDMRKQFIKDYQDHERFCEKGKIYVQNTCGKMHVYDCPHCKRLNRTRDVREVQIKLNKRITGAKGT